MARKENRIVSVDKLTRLAHTHGNIHVYKDIFDHRRRRRVIDIPSKVGALPTSQYYYNGYSGY